MVTRSQDYHLEIFILMGQFINNINLLVTVLELGKFKVRGPEDLVPHDALLCVSKKISFSCVLTE